MNGEKDSSPDSRNGSKFASRDMIKLQSKRNNIADKLAKKQADEQRKANLKRNAQSVIGSKRNLIQGKSFGCYSYLLIDNLIIYSQ